MNKISTFVWTTVSLTALATACGGLEQELEADQYDSLEASCSTGTFYPSGETETTELFESVAIEQDIVPCSTPTLEMYSTTFATDSRGLMYPPPPTTSPAPPAVPAVPAPAPKKGQLLRVKVKNLRPTSQEVTFIRIENGKTERASTSVVVAPGATIELSHSSWNMGWQLGLKTYQFSKLVQTAKGEAVSKTDQDGNTILETKATKPALYEIRRK